MKIYMGFLRSLEALGLALRSGRAAASSESCLSIQYFSLSS
ncbi:hypothetical protein PSN_3199 [Pseudomonas sp. NGC7]